MAWTIPLKSSALIEREHHRAQAESLGARGGLLSALVLVSHLACGHDVIDLATPRGAPDGSRAPDAVGGAAGNGTVVCTTNEECAAVGGVCMTEQHRCVECTDNSHCVPWAPLCDMTTNECVQCFVSSQCPMGTSCDPTVLRCVVACTSNTDCFGPIPICDQTRAACVQCETNEQCLSQPIIGDRNPICSLGYCIQCLEDEDCPFSSPYCLQRVGRCVECFQSSDCGFGYECDPFEGRCRPIQ